MLSVGCVTFTDMRALHCEAREAEHPQLWAAGDDQITIESAGQGDRQNAAARLLGALASGHVGLYFGFVRQLTPGPLLGADLRSIHLFSGEGGQGRQARKPHNPPLYRERVIVATFPEMLER